MTRIPSFLILWITLSIALATGPLAAAQVGAAQVGATRVRTCGSEFAPYGLEGATLSQALDYVGQVHNEYQEAILSQLVSERVNLRDQAALKAAIDQKTAAFFSQRGIDASPYYVSPDFRGETGGISFRPEDYSPEGAAILTQLQAVVGAATEDNLADTLARLNGLKEAALGLRDDAEVIKVGAPISVAIHSFSYWQANTDRWTDALARSGGGSTKNKCKIKWVATGLSDLAGGIRGATFGSILTPVGGLIGGTVQASVSSAANLLGQGIACLFGWL